MDFYTRFCFIRMILINWVWSVFRLIGTLTTTTFDFVFLLFKSHIELILRKVFVWRVWRFIRGFLIQKWIVPLLLYKLISVALRRWLIVCFVGIFSMSNRVVVIVPVLTSDLLLTSWISGFPTISLLGLWHVSIVVLFWIPILVTIIIVVGLVSVLICLLCFWAIISFSIRLFSPSQGKRTGPPWCLGNSFISFASFKVCIISIVSVH